MPFGSIVLRRQSPFVRVARDRHGAALVEFAILAPVLMLLLLGIVGYGQYLFVAHSIQQIANDAARASIAGIGPAERAAIARDVVRDGAETLPAAASGQVDTAVDEAGDRLRVAVSVDATALSILRVPLVPMPDPVIVRRAAIRIPEA